ncbi:MAG: hypothetical protein ABIJ72_03575 [bacterium]
MKKIFFVFLPLVFLCGCVNADVLSIRSIEKASTTPEKTSIVEISSGQFIPSKISVKRNQEIKITNLDKTLYTLLSDPHPTHDQIKSLYVLIYKNQTRSFKIPKKGSFGIHAEENPSVNLKIVVE